MKLKCYFFVLHSTLSDMTVCQFQREDGCQMLIDLLGWKSFTQNDLAQSSCLDCIYDSVMFCVNKGFTWTEVVCVIKLVCEMLKAAECKYITCFFLQKVYNR